MLFRDKKTPGQKVDRGGALEGGTKAMIYAKHGDRHRSCGS